MTTLIVANDLVGVGKVALTISLPILAICQVEALPLPTVLLSSHTGGFPLVHKRVLSEDLKAFLRQWDQLDHQAEAMLTGYCSDPKQLEELSTFTKQHQIKRIVDPIMGDRGQLYTGFDRDYVKAMRQFCREAELILPNLTEAALLTDTPYLEDGTYDQEDLVKLMRQMANLGPRKVIVTGVSFDDEQIGLAYWDSETDEVAFVMGTKHPGHFFGTGDVLSAILAASYSLGLDVKGSAELALNFIDRVVRSTLASHRDPACGLVYEPHLGYLYSEIDALLEEKK